MSDQPSPEVHLRDARNCASLSLNQCISRVLTAVLPFRRMACAGLEPTITITEDNCTDMQQALEDSLNALRTVQKIQMALKEIGVERLSKQSGHLSQHNAVQAVGPAEV